jgi:hypothetical protein
MLVFVAPMFGGDPPNEVRRHEISQGLDNDWVRVYR